MRIEILGPSGVGKTTILNMVQPLWEDRIIFPQKIDMFIDSATQDEVMGITNSFFAKKQSLRTYLSYTLHIIAKAPLMFHQVFKTIQYTQDSIKHYVISDIHSFNGSFLIHDELLLHRGLSFLHFFDDIQKTTRLYYEHVPVPDVALIFKAPAPVILERIEERNYNMNCYRGLQGEELKMAVLKILSICTLAAEILAKRGVEVRFIDVSGTPEEASSQLNDIIYEFFIGKKEDASAESIENLKNRSIESCKSFRKKSGRHYPKTADVMYCAFSTPNFTVHRHESQRDAPTRFERFGMDKNALQGKRVLDLGSNIGAMLFQATNFSIAEGLGIEFDYDKVKIAQEIAELSQLDNLSFRQGDIDKLDAKELGVFDVTFALAVDKHVQEPEKLYKLLGEVTEETLYFEGNSSCNVEQVMQALREAGFKSVEYLGFCSDDIVPSNNYRTMLKATK